MGNIILCSNQEDDTNSLHLCLEDKMLDLYVFSHIGQRYIFS
jgi:hypothetical protein